MMVCVVYCVGKWRRVGVNSIPEMELQLNSNSNLGIGIGIEIGGFENGIGVEIQNWFFCNCYYSIN